MYNQNQYDLINYGSNLKLTGRCVSSYNQMRMRVLNERERGEEERGREAEAVWLSGVCFCSERTSSGQPADTILSRGQEA